MAAIRLDVDEKMTEVGSFDCLVQPKHNLILSPYRIALTGIQLAAADTLGLCFADPVLGRFHVPKSGYLTLNRNNSKSGVSTICSSTNRTRTCGFDQPFSRRT